MRRRLEVKMPEPAADGPHLDALFPDRTRGRELRVAVTRSGDVLFVVRRPTGAITGTPLAVWVLSADEWGATVARVQRMLSDVERFAGAFVAVGTERAVRREDALLRAFERVLAKMEGAE